MTPTDPDRLCRTCRQRLDAVLWAAGRHPGCRSSPPPISDQAEARLIDHLATSLSAVVLTEKTTQ